MLGVRLGEDVERALTSLARRTRRSKSDIAREAIERFVAMADGDSRARAQWAEINRAEATDPEINAVLDWAQREVDSL